MPCKIIRSSISTSPEDIAEASNSQKPIKPEDLVANTQEQKTLKGKLKEVGIQYLTKRGETIEKPYRDKNCNIKLSALGKLGLASIAQMPAQARNKSNSIYGTVDEKPWYYNSVFRPSSPHIYKDLIKIENLYRSFSKRSLNRVEHPEVARNARTFVLASIAFICVYFAGDDREKLSELVKNFSNENEAHKKLVGLIQKQDCIIKNKHDDELNKMEDFFICLSNDVLGYVFVDEKEQNETLSATNMFKDRNIYPRCLRRLLGQLRNDRSDVYKSSDVLFRRNDSRK